MAGLLRGLLSRRRRSHRSFDNADPFMRQGTSMTRFVKRYRSMPFAVRMFGIGVLGFVFGAIIEVFACKTHLYESVIAKKDTRRHDFDEFVVDLRQRVDRLHREVQTTS